MTSAYSMPRRPSAKPSGFGRVLGTVLWMIPLTILRGMVLAKLWEWFVSDTFPKVHELSVYQAIGISVFTGFILAGLVDTDEEVGVAESVIKSLIINGLFMGVGLIVVQFA